jgi:hypothetical protein
LQGIIDTKNVIALSLYRDNVFGIDNTLQGAWLRYHPQGFDGAVFGGRIQALQAPVAINPVPNQLINRQVFLAGTSVSVSPAKGTKISGHYVLAVNEALDSGFYTKYWHTGGVIVSQENLLDGLDAYAEGNVVFQQQLLSGEYRNMPTASGSFAALVWSPVPWKVKLEGKDYRAYDFDFRRPPSLEEDVVVDVNTQNVTAARLTIERQLGNAKNTVYTSFIEGQDRAEEAAINHGVIGTKFVPFGRSEWEAKAGYRWQPGFSNLAHADLKAKFPTFKGQAFEIEAKKQFWNRDLRLGTKDDRNVLGLTYTFSENVNISAGYEYVPTNDPSTGRNFYNAGGTYKTGNLVAKAFVGQTSGGSVCSGGVCRQVPPYSGGMVETTYSF